MSDSVSPRELMDTISLPIQHVPYGGVWIQSGVLVQHVPYGGMWIQPNLIFIGVGHWGSGHTCV